MKTGIAKNITFPSGVFHLEGLLIRGESSKSVVISHPHPLYGGNMDNYVVGLLTRTFDELGWTTLRFNFRGVGQSQGNFDQGRGEREDVSAALAYLKALGIKQITLAGYSFGAWVNAQTGLNNPEIRHSILISPPLTLMDFSFLRADTKTGLIIVGDDDPLCPIPSLKKLVQEMKEPPSLKIIQEADHFFSSGSEELITVIKEIEPIL